VSGYLRVSTRFGVVAREQTVRILAEMVANVIVVEVAVDEQVAAGDTVCLLESMKMEIPVLAETGGVVSAIRVAPGDVVQEGDILVELTARR
jgi:acetyl-CoA carboxylase biotin carboxyl carrier protein